MQPVKIGTLESVATIGCVAMSSIILTIPTFTIQTFGTGSLTHIIYIIIVSTIILSILFSLFFKFPNKDFVDISEYAGGKFFKYFSGFLAIIYFLLTAILTIAEFSENIRNILFENASSSYISILLVIGMFFGVSSGIRGIFRTSMLIAPVILFGMLLLFFSLFGNIDVTNYTPIFGNGIKEFFFPGSFRIEIFESIFLILFMGPQIKNIKKATIGSFILISIISLSIFVLLIGIFPYPSILENYFPLFELNRLINFGRFIQRVESFYSLLWLIAIYVHISLETSYAVQVFAKILDIKYIKRIIPMFCVIVLLGTLILESYIDILAIRSFMSVYIIPLVLYSYSLFILILATFKQRRKQNAKI